MTSDEFPPEPLHFDEFPVLTYDEWQAAAVASLDGKPFEKLITQTYEGIPLQPIYREEDAAELPFAATLPGQPPFVRGTWPAGYLAGGWAIAQGISGATPDEYNSSLHEATKSGQLVVMLEPDAASRVGLDPDAADAGSVGVAGVSLSTAADLSVALAGVDLRSTPLRVRVGAAPAPLVALLEAAAARVGLEPGQLAGWIENDPLGALVEMGGLPVSVPVALDDMVDLTRWALERAPGLGTIAVHTTAYHDAGANAVQELAVALATGVAYLRAHLDHGQDIDAVAPRMGFEFAVGGQFFMEIAKLRAARLLWSQVVAAFGGDESAQGMRLHARSAHFNKTAIDPYINMLRVTTEGLSAAVAGVDSLGLAPFDAAVRPPDAFAQRIARNAQIILQEEASLARLIDPAGGSWAVESLTARLAEAAWALFQEIEQRGGMAAALESGYIQDAIEAVATKRAAAVAKRKDVIVGVNQFAYPAEKPLPRQTPDDTALQTERAAVVASARERGGEAARQALATVAAVEGPARVEAAAAAAAAGATLGQLAAALRREGDRPANVRPLRLHRASEPFEALRDLANAYTKERGQRPRLFLANLGPPRQHKARADFTRGFFEVGGFEVLTNNGFKTVEDAAAAALASGAPAVAICSTDETYPELVPPLVGAIKSAAPQAAIILAGRPTEQVDALRAAGVDEFIYLGADAVGLNRWLLERITE